MKIPFIRNAQRWLRFAAWAALAGSAAWYCLCVRLSGGSVAAFALYLLLAVVLVLLPGVFLAAWLLPRITGAGRAACGFALGLGLLAVLALFPAGGVPLRMRLFFPLLLLPALLLAIVCTAKKSSCGLWRALGDVLWHGETRLSATAASSHSRPPIQQANDGLPFSLLLLCVAGGLLVYSFSGVLAFAHASAAGNMVYHQDMLWSVGNGAAVQFGLPLRDIRAAGGQLYYHYLSDALPGLLALAGNLLPYDAACYYNYPLLATFLVCAAYAAARAYGATRRVAALLPLALLFLQGFGSPNTLELLRNMNGVPAATLLACVLLLLVFTAQHESFKPTLGFYAAYAAVCGVLLMSKNLYAILIICAIFAAAVAGSLVRRKFLKVPFCLAAVGAAMVALCWGLVFRHAINNLVQQLWLSPWALLVSVCLWLPLGAALYAASLVLSLRRFGSLSLARLVVNAAALGGFLAYFLFNHYSGSQTYFILAAFLFLWFCALDAAPLVQRLRPARWLAGALAVVSLAGTALTLLPVAQKGAQVALRCAGLRPAYPVVEETVTPDDEAAALWLRANMGAQDIFATNRNAKSAAIGEGTWHYYTAMSGRQAFVESWRYAMDYGFEYHALRHNLEQVSDVIFAKTDAAEAFALAKGHGIRYLLVSLPLKPLPFTGAEPVFENASVRIYEVVDAERP